MLRPADAPATALAARALALPSPRMAGLWLVSRLALVRQRRALADLDDARLADLGLTRDQAQAEAGRPFWDAPRHWR